MPPGTEYGAVADRAPDGVYYFRIYGGIHAVLNGLVAIFGAVMMFAPLWTSSSSGTEGPDAAVMVVMGLVYGGMGVLFLVPTLLALFGGRRPWVHVLGTVVIAMGMLTLCCIPVLIPLMLVWQKPETRAWYGTR